MSNLSQLFDAGRFPGGVEVRPDGKAAVMTPADRKTAVCGCSPCGKV